MVFIVLLGIFLAVGTLGEHIIGDHGKGQKFPFDVTVSDGCIQTVSGQPSIQQPFLRQSINLYDFRKQLEARKVIEEDTCYIRKFSGTYDEAVKAVTSAKAKAGASIPVSEEWNIPGKKIPSGKLTKTVGRKITKFCSGYKVVWENENKKLRDLHAQIVKRQWTVTGNAGYNPNTGIGAKGGIGYDNGKGFSAGLNGGWSQGGGFSASAGVKWTFGK